MPKRGGAKKKRKKRTQNLRSIPADAPLFAQARHKKSSTTTRRRGRAEGGWRFGGDPSLNQPRRGRRRRQKAKSGFFFLPPQKKNPLKQIRAPCRFLARDSEKKKASRREEELGRRAGERVRESEEGQGGEQRNKTREGRTRGPRRAMERGAR